MTIKLLIGKSREVEGWIDKLNTNTPSVPQYKAKLKAFVSWQATDRCIKQQEIAALQKAAAANKKKRSKKTIGLTVVDADSYTLHREEKEKKKANARNQKKGFNKKEQRRPPQHNKRK